MVLATSRHQHSGNGDSERYHTHQRLSSRRGWSPGLLPLNGCTALGLWSCQMLALLEHLMNFATAEQMRVLNRTEMKGQGVEVEQKNRRGAQKHAESRGLAYLLMKEALIESSLYPNPPQTISAQRELFILLELQHACPCANENNPKIRSIRFVWAGEKKADTPLTDNKLVENDDDVAIWKSPEYSLHSWWDLTVHLCVCWCDLISQPEPDGRQRTCLKVRHNSFHGDITK